MPEPGPSRALGVRLRRRADAEMDEEALASALLDCLLEGSALEVVNDHARKALVTPLAEHMGAKPSPELAARLAQVFEDADEVVDLYIDDAALADLLRRVR